jgi:hypothetical protein
VFSPYINPHLFAGENGGNTDIIQVNADHLANGSAEFLHREVFELLGLLANDSVGDMLKLEIA